MRASQSAMPFVGSRRSTRHFTALLRPSWLQLSRSYALMTYRESACRSDLSKDLFLRWAVVAATFWRRTSACPATM